MSSKDDVTSSEGHREIRVEGNYFEYVAGNVYTGTVIIQRDGREIQLPLQRPPRPEFFTGRNQELAQLLQDLQPGRVVTLCGPGGIGKTALAAEAIWRLAENEELLQRFPDGIIFHSFYGRPDVNLALEHIATSFGAEPKPTPESAALRVLAGKRALLFLDGTEEASDLRTVLNVRGECGVIVTSRRRKDAVAERQDIQSLQTDEAVTLLQAWGGDQAADETTATRICELVGDLPLAVRIVGRFLNETGETAAEYLNWLQDQPLEALHQGEHREESVNVLLKRSLEQVSEVARQVLAVSGVLAFAPFSREVVAAAFKSALEGGQGGVHSHLTRKSPLEGPALSTSTSIGIDSTKEGQGGVHPIRKPLNELVSYGLLLRSGDRYEVSHALIHTYARRRMTVEPEVIKRLTVYYSAFTRKQQEQGVEGYTRLDTERAHLMRVMESCQGQGDWKAVTDLVKAADNYLDIRGYWTERQIALKMGVIATQHLRDRWEEEMFWGKLGITYRMQGNLVQAVSALQQALTIARKIGDRHGEGSHLGNLGLAYIALGQMKQAIDYNQQALIIAREIDDRHGEGTCLGYLGLAYRDLGQAEQAIDWHRQALVISREIGDRRAEGVHLGNLGLAYRDLRQIERAIDCYQQALSIANEIGDRRSEGIVMGKLGTAYRDDLGQVAQAIEYHTQALIISREIGDRRHEGIWLGNLGFDYRALGQQEQAIDCSQQALAIFRQIGDHRHEGIHLGNLGGAYRDLGQIEKAIDYYQQALTISREIGDRRTEMTQLGNLGLAYRDLGQVEQAKQSLQETLAILKEIKSPNTEEIRKWLDELEATGTLSNE